MASAVTWREGPRMHVNDMDIDVLLKSEVWSNTHEAFMNELEPFEDARPLSMHLTVVASLLAVGASLRTVVGSLELAALLVEEALSAVSLPPVPAAPPCASRLGSESSGMCGGTGGASSSAEDRRGGVPTGRAGRAT
mmetsp:Transcript_23267/g.65101  ORF Transcript_23267/g.65101 Transcript_23267/m.65101 type:complete len:137 (-) Transcript_23267:121-531(-)